MAQTTASSLYSDLHRASSNPRRRTEPPRSPGIAGWLNKTLIPSASLPDVKALDTERASSQVGGEELGLGSGARAAADDDDATPRNGSPVNGRPWTVDRLGESSRDDAGESIDLRSPVPRITVQSSSPDLTQVTASPATTIGFTIPGAFRHSTPPSPVPTITPTSRPPQAPPATHPTSNPSSTSVFSFFPNLPNLPNLPSFNLQSLVPRIPATFGLNLSLVDDSPTRASKPALRVGETVGGGLGEDFEGGASPHSTMSRMSMDLRIDQGTSSMSGWYFGRFSLCDCLREFRGEVEVGILT